MKKLILLVVCIQCAVFVQAGKARSSYTITGRSINKTLPKGTAVFKLRCFEPDGGYMKESVNINIDFDCNETVGADSTGVIRFAVPEGKHVLYIWTLSYKEINTKPIDAANQEVIEMDIRFEVDNEPRPMKKPVIYVYPEQKTEMAISLDVKGALTFAYPEYKNGWNFTASPGGNIEMNGKDYNYLFWEGGNAVKALEGRFLYNDGYFVASDTLLVFLENSLTQMGFTSKEQQDFITFWYPQMIKNKINYVRFVFNDACNAFAELKCTPKPTSMYRMSMFWYASEDGKMYTGDIDGLHETELKPQEFPVIKRDGLTLIEWGGAELDFSASSIDLSK